jgi:hypothetical protein
VHQVCGRSGKGNSADMRRVTEPILGGRVRVEQVCGRSGKGNSADIRRVTDYQWAKYFGGVMRYYTVKNG